MPESSSTSRADRFARLVPPGVTLLGVFGLMFAARFYELFPVKPAPCGMRTLTGMPCLACGGTRAMQALSEGDFVAAFLFNPLVIVGVAAAMTWFGVTLWRTVSGKASSPIRRPSTRWIVTILVLLAAANWLYLLFNLPP